jgi:hypothetical protein
MGYKIALLGPGMYVLVALFLADAVAATYLVLNALRRPASDYAGVPEGRWSYVVPQALYVVLYVVAQAPVLGKLFPWAGVYALAAPLIIAQQLAYLLRVVFPTHGRLEARLEAAGAALLARTPAVSDDDAPITRSTTNA